jgi:hypothetical protein
MFSTKKEANLQDSQVVFNVLKVEKISEIYMKHKHYFYNQLMINNLTKSVFSKLKDTYSLDKKVSKFSFIKQLSNVDEQVGTESSVEERKAYLEKIVKLFKCGNAGLCDSLLFQLNELDRHKQCDEKYGETRKIISLLLYN